MLAKGPQLNSYHVRRPVMTLLFGLMIQTIFIATVMIIDRYFEFVGPMFNFIDRSLGREVGDIVSTVVFQTTLSIPLAIFVIWLSTEKMKSIYSYSLCSLFSLIMVALPFLSITSRSHTSEQVAGTLIVFQLFVFPIAILALVIFTPLSALTRRLWSVAIGLTFLMIAE